MPKIVLSLAAGLAVASSGTAQLASPAPAPAAAAPAGGVDDPPPTVIVRTVPHAAAASAPVAAPVPSATPEPLICRTSIATGSLIAKHKQCLTKAQWRYVDDAHETEARRLMLENMSKPGCNGPSC